MLRSKGEKIKIKNNKKTATWNPFSAPIFSIPKVFSIIYASLHPWGKAKSFKKLVPPFQSPLTAENQHNSPPPAWIQASSSQPLASHSAAACTSPEQQWKNESAILGLYYTLAINRIKLQETVPINAYPPFSVSQLSLQRFLSVSCCSFRPCHMWGVLWYNYQNAIIKKFSCSSTRAVFEEHVMAWGRQKIVIAVGQQGQGSDSTVLISTSSSFLTRDALNLCHRYQRIFRKGGTKHFLLLKRQKVSPNLEDQCGFQHSSCSPKPWR